MKKNIKIVFGQPRYFPSSIDGIEFYYPYQIINTQKEKYKIEENESSSFEIKISISGSLAITWGFQIWQPSENYSELVRLLLPYGLEEIKKKYKEGTLNKFEEIVLLLSNHPSKRIYNIDELPEVAGFEEIITIAEKEIAEEIQENKLAGEIIQYRDLINAIVYNNHSKRLIELDQERNLLEFFKSAKTNEDFSHRIASLGALIGKLNKKLLIKLTESTDNSLGTIALLELLVKKYDEEKIIITEILRQINRLRQAYPIHTDKATGVISAHEYFGIDYPVTNYDKAWKILLGKYLFSLKNLFELIKINMMKK